MALGEMGLGDEMKRRSLSSGPTHKLVPYTGSRHKSQTIFTIFHNKACVAYFYFLLVLFKTNLSCFLGIRWVLQGSEARCIRPVFGGHGLCLWLFAVFPRV